jgi:hypothetical protein
MAQPDQAEELMRRGFEALDADETEAVIEIALQLNERRHSSAFEIQALAHAADGELEAAVETLKEGVEPAK